MRKAAGILLMILGMTMLVSSVVLVIQYDIHVDKYPFHLLMIISGVFLVTGGVFCLKRRYWKICFASSLFLVVLMVFLFYLGSPFGWLTLHTIPAWILPIIFVRLRKTEWQEIQG
jgi:hypothetical membrane protein